MALGVELGKRGNQGLTARRAMVIVVGVKAREFVLPALEEVETAVIAAADSQTLGA